MRSSSPWIDFDLYLITDRKQTGGRNLEFVVEDALRGGVRAIQLREKDLSSKELYELAYEMRKLTTRHNASSSSMTVSTLPWQWMRTEFIWDTTACPSTGPGWSSGKRN